MKFFSYLFNSIFKICEYLCISCIPFYIPHKMGYKKDNESNDGEDESNNFVYHPIFELINRDYDVHGSYDSSEIEPLTIPSKIKCYTDNEPHTMNNIPDKYEIEYEIIDNGMISNITVPITPKKKQG